MVSYHKDILKATRVLKSIDEKLRLMILMSLGYEDNQRKQIEYFIDLLLSDKEIADLLQVEKKYISKERCVIKKLRNSKLRSKK